MLEFPILVEKYAYEHKGGTKEYHLMFITNSQGQSILVRRWGKVGKATNIQIDIQGVARSTLTRHQNERRTKGYSLVSTGVNTATAHNLTNLIAIISRPVWAKFGADAISAICPSVDVSGLKPTRQADYDEDGHIIPNDRLAAQAQNLLEEVEAAQKAEVKSANASIAGFGRF